MTPLCLAATLIGITCAATTEPIKTPDICGQLLVDNAGQIVVQGTCAPLCINGHPAKRLPNISYAGLPPRHGYQRDHIIPLCLGGPDTRDNLQYQPLDQAYAKDQLERQACEQYCRGEITLDQARRRF